MMSTKSSFLLGAFNILFAAASFSVEREQEYSSKSLESLHDEQIL